MSITNGEYLILNDTDILIVGAGPAGCSTAIFCVQNNLNVTLIDIEENPKPKPGESLHPGVLSLFKQLGILDQFLAAGFLRYSGNWVKWENNIPHFQSFGEDDLQKWQGFQVWRPYFDKILLNYAKNIGVNVIQSCKALNHIQSNKKRIIGINTTQGEFKSSFLIDSSGGSHWLARRIGLTIRKYTPRLIAHYGYVKGTYPSRDEAPLIIAEKDGWLWTAKIKENTYQWVRLFFQPKEINSSLIPTEFSKPIEIFRRGSDVTWRIASNLSGKGYFIIGDAAFVLDPLSSHGILKAIMSGMMAG